MSVEPVTARPVRTVAIDELRSLMRALLVAAGCDEENAAIAAEVFLEADLRGVGLQGLDHMPTMIGNLRSGRVDGRARPRIAVDEPAYALIDGQAGPGQVAGRRAADLAADKARESGCATVAVTNSADLFMIGYYAERMANAGVVGLVFSDAPPLVRPHGGAERRLGTNPLSIGIPAAEGEPVVLDISTSAQSASRVRQAAYHAEALPQAEGVDASGRQTDEAAAIRAGGAIGPLAGHKGFGLGLCVALLAGPLTGSATGRGLQAWLDQDPAPRAPKGHLFVAIDPAAFGEPASFRARVREYLDDIRSARPLPGVDAIRIPGERSRKAREASLRAGRVQVYEAVWARIAELAGDLGVTLPGTTGTS